MNPVDFFLSVSAELLSATVLLVLGGVLAKIPRSLEMHKLQKFFGDAVKKENLRIVYGLVSRIETDEFAEANKTLQKRYHDGRVIPVKLGREIITREVIRAFSYVFQWLGYMRSSPVAVCTDSDAFVDLNCTFISVGGPVTNEITHLALNERTNRFLRFHSILEDATKPWKIEAVSYDRTKLAYELGEGKDYGIIMKIKNSRFPDHFFFVCAGIATWGTSGAAWYFANHWKKLYKEFGTNEFGIVVEVRQGSDNSAVRVFP